jgi:hypothetical protein
MKRPAPNSRPAFIQLCLPFLSETAPVVLTTHRRYVRHQRKHVIWLQRNYCMYTLREAAAILGLTPGKVLYLCRTHQIRKRAPNKRPHPRKQTAHTEPLPLAA